MKIEALIKILDADFFTGVPDSLLSPLCNYLYSAYGIDPQHHVIAANEGNAVSLAAGYHLATGRVPVVYMQNSGQGNAVNPIASLLNEKVYAIPMVFVVGWRGEPGVHDEPQHIFQGEITLRLLEDLGIQYMMVDSDTPEEAVSSFMDGARNDVLKNGQQVALVVKKGALSYDKKNEFSNGYPLVREEIIRHISAAAGDGFIISTTGKASRELFEIREAEGKGHGRDFLTVGSMGHGSSIALGVASFKPGTKVWCIDGDGAALMHMGAMAVIGSQKPGNLIHIVINNGSHETVGGLPTVAGDIDLCGVAKACGYPVSLCVDSYEALDRELSRAAAGDALTFIEVKCGLGARADLGRPTTTAIENKQAFMESLRECLK